MLEPRGPCAEAFAPTMGITPPMRDDGLGIADSAAGAPPGLGMPDRTGMPVPAVEVRLLSMLWWW